MLPTVATLVILVSAPGPLRLPELLAEVGDRAPAVEVAEASVDASRAAIRVAGAWDDAELSVMAERLALPGGDPEEPAMITYRVGQPLNLFGRRAAARRVARAAVDRDRAVLRRVAWDARARAVGLFYELWMTDEMRRILDDQIQLLTRMRESALARVRAGMDMGHHDVLRAESQIAAMEAERASLDDERAAIVAMLNTLRGRAPDAELGAPELPVATPLPALDLATAAARRSPEVEAATAMLAQSDASETVARKMYLPMVMVEAQYEQNFGGMADGFGVALGVRVPLWWDRPRSEVAMARAMTRVAIREREAMTTMADAEARMAWSRTRAAERTLSALEGTALPRMRDTIASIQAAYVAGRGEFLALLDAIMELRELEAQRLRAVVARGVARFELDRIAGREVSP